MLKSVVPEKARWTFRTDVTSVNMSSYFTTLKTMSISCNWTDQWCCSLTKWYISFRTTIVLFVDGLSYLHILQTYYLDINWRKILQNMLLRFLTGLFFAASMRTFNIWLDPFEHGVNTGVDRGFLRSSALRAQTDNSTQLPSSIWKNTL